MEAVRRFLRTFFRVKSFVSCYFLVAYIAYTMELC